MAPQSVKVVSSLDAATLAALHEGARVVLLPKYFTVHYPTAMTPPFWSPIMFGNQTPDARNPVRSEASGLVGISPLRRTRIGSGSSWSPTARPSA